MPDTVADEILREIAPQGRLRAAINFGNPVLAQQDAETGEAKGVSAALARALAERLGLPIEIVCFTTAGLVAQALAAEDVDVAFLAIDADRARQIAFTAPYVQIEATYMVPEGSALRTPEEVDSPGIRIAVGARSAYDLYLARHLVHAERISAQTSNEALNMFLERGLDAAASIRQPLMAFARSHPGLRIMDDAFMKVFQAMAVPGTRPHARDYVHDFLEEMKASGFVAEALRESGRGDVTVPPAQPRTGTVR